MTRPGVAADRPEVELRVDGQQVDRSVLADVVEVDASEEVGRHGRCSLLLLNWDPDRQGVRWSDDGPFRPGADLEVALGHHSELSTVFAGVVTALTAHFPSGAAPLLRVEARSRSVLLDAPRRSRVHTDVTDADVARALAAGAGLEVDAADGPARPQVVQDRTSDWEHLVGRADALGWVTYVRGSTLVLRPPSEPVEPLALTWTLDLVELHLGQDVGHLGGSAEVRGWDPERLEAVSAEADASRAGLDVGERDDHSSSVGATGWSDRVTTAASTTWRSGEEAEALAAGSARRAELRHVSGTGRTTGRASLRCDSWVTVEGVGRRLSGPHYVTAVRHRSGVRGFSTELQLGLPAPLQPAAAAGPAPTALVVGLVEGLDDPLGWGRVSVVFPWQADAPDAVWARLATVDAGPEHGTFFLPDPGQEVLVGFLDGDPAGPVVLGALWNGQQAPPLTVDPDTNALRAVVSRSGHRVLFDDADPGALTVETAGGRRLVLSDADATITLSEPDAGNSVVLSDGGIELTASRGDIVLSASSGSVRIEATSIEGSATGGASIESSTTLDLKASATLGLSGALVTVN